MTAKLTCTNSPTWCLIRNSKTYLDITSKGTNTALIYSLCNNYNKTNFFYSYVNWVLPPDKRDRFKRVDSRLGSESGYVEPDGAYEDGWSCWPPPACMVLVSVLEIICFILNQYLQRDSKWIDDANGPVAKYLIYNPEKRQESWRFLTYMFVHIG